MGTSQVTPLIAATTQTWLKQHERLILAPLVLGVVLFGLNRWFDRSAADANMKAAAAATVAAEAQASRKQADAQEAVLLAQVNQQMALLTAQVASDKQTIASLVATVASRDAASSKQVASVSGTKTPPQAVADLTSAYPHLPQPIVPTDTGAQVSTEDLQQFTVAAIERDTAKADLQDTRSQLAAAQDEVTNDEAIIGQKNRVIAQDAITLQAHDTQATADVNAAKQEAKAAKAEARKSKWHTFWWGFAAGFGARSVIPIPTK
jgi:hypothetical protein